MWRLVGSAVVLTLLAIWLDTDRILATLTAVHAGWLGVALAGVVVQIVLSAGRWWYTARCLGLTLGLRRAVAEYWLGTALNQILPGGVLGDAARAARHARWSRTRPAVVAVVIERASGQLVIALLAVAGLLVLPELRSALTPAEGLARTALTAASVVVAAAGAGCWWILRRRGSSSLPLRKELVAGLLRPRVLGVQLVTSTAVVGSYIAVFWAVARGVDIPLDPFLSVLLVPWVLLGMLIPLGWGGWGVREGAAALVWMAMGWSPEQGVAISLIYGAVTLVGALPGLALLSTSVKNPVK